MAEKPQITHVYHWPNGMTMVFDQFGQQMPDYQGPTSEVLASIQRDEPRTAIERSDIQWPRPSRDPDQETRP